MGLSVTRLVIAPAFPIEDQVRQAFISGARAAVVADGHRTKFWVADEEGSDRVAMRGSSEIETSPASIRALDPDRRIPPGQPGPRDLRAELPPPPVVTGPPPPAETEAPFFRQLAAGVMASTGRLGAFPTIAAGLRARLVGPIGLELGGYAPVGNETLSVVDGQIDTTVWMAGGGVVLAPRTEQRVSAEAGAGVMAVVVHSVGTPALRRWRPDRRRRRSGWPSTAAARPGSGSRRAGRCAST